MTFGLLPAQKKQVASSPLVIFLGDLKLATLLYSEQRAEDNDYGASLGCLTHEMSSCYSDSSVAQWLFNRGQTKFNVSNKV